MAIFEVARPIIDKGSFPDEKALRKAIETAMDDALKDSTLKRLREFVQTWESDTKPKFTVVKADSGGDIIRQVTVDPEYPFLFVSEGTEPHIISAPPGGRLAFNVGSVPKTKPNNFKAGPGSPGTTSVRAVRVNHPGIEPRNIIEKALESAEGSIENRLEKAFEGLGV